MNLYWIMVSLASGLTGGGITYILTGNWQISLIASTVIFIVVVLSNPKKRYMKAFYIALFPLISNIYFTIQSKTENFDIQAGLKELDVFTTVLLGGICIVCLLLDFLERTKKWKWSGNLILINRNSNKNISGNNVNIHQTINKKDTSTND